MKRKKERVCTGSELAKALAKTSLSEDEAKAWRRDLRSAQVVEGAEGQVAISPKKESID